MNLTDKWRIVARVLWVVGVLAAIGGWFMGLDPKELSSVIGWLTAAVGTGELAMVGKRATYKVDHHDNANGD